MKEKDFWTKIRSIIREEKIPGRWERVENGIISGMPDVNYCVRGKEGWIELKSGRAPAKNTTIVFKSTRGLDQSQVNWHLFQAQNGGNSMILIRLDGRNFAFPGRLAAEINGLTLEEMASFEVKLADFLWELVGN